MKYKVGDRVKIREDLIEGKKFGGNAFVLEMKPWCGQVVTISDLWGEGYRLEHGNDFVWTDEMIEGLAVDDAVTQTIIAGH